MAESLFLNPMCGPSKPGLHYQPMRNKRGTKACIRATELKTPGFPGSFSPGFRIKGAGTPTLDSTTVSLNRNKSQPDHDRFFFSFNFY